MSNVVHSNFHYFGFHEIFCFSQGWMGGGPVLVSFLCGNASGVCGNTRQQIYFEMVCGGEKKTPTFFAPPIIVGCARRHLAGQKFTFLFFHFF